MAGPTLTLAWIVLAVAPTGRADRLIDGSDSSREETSLLQIKNPSAAEQAPGRPEPPPQSATRHPRQVGLFQQMPQGGGGWPPSQGWYDDFGNNMGNNLAQVVNCGPQQNQNGISNLDIYETDIATYDSRGNLNGYDIYEDVYWTGPQQNQNQPINADWYETDVPRYDNRGNLQGYDVYEDVYWECPQQNTQRGSNNQNWNNNVNNQNWNNNVNNQNWNNNVMPSPVNQNGNWNNQNWNNNWNNQNWDSSWGTVGNQNWNGNNQNWGNGWGSFDNQDWGSSWGSFSLLSEAPIEADASVDATDVAKAAEASPENEAGTDGTQMPKIHNADT